MTDQDHDDLQTPKRRTYESPELKELGSMEELTHGPMGGAIDGIFGGIGGFQAS